jgi:hypothetical protein
VGLSEFGWNYTDILVVLLLDQLSTNTDSKYSSRDSIGYLLDSVTDQLDTIYSEIYQDIVAYMNFRICTVIDHECENIYGYQLVYPCRQYRIYRVVVTMCKGLSEH